MTLTLLESVRRQRLFEQDSLLQRLAPFAVVYAAAFALYPVGDPSDLDAWFAGALAVAALTLASIGLMPWHRLPAAAQVVPLAAYLVSVALLREGHGGASSGYAPLVLVAIVWAAIFGRRRVLAFVVGGAFLTIALPPLLTDSAHYPAGELRRAVLFVLVGALCGVVIQSLIRSLLDTEARLTRLRGAEIHDDLVQAFAVAQLALQTGDTARAGAAVRGGLDAAQALAAEMLGGGAQHPVEPGMLRRARSTG